MAVIKSTNPVFLFLKCRKTTLGSEISTITKTNKHRTLWRKCTHESAYVCTQMTKSRLI